MLGPSIALGKISTLFGRHGGIGNGIVTLSSCVNSGAPTELDMFGGALDRVRTEESIACDHFPETGWCTESEDEEY